MGKPYNKLLIQDSENQQFKVMVVLMPGDILGLVPVGYCCYDYYSMQYYIEFQGAWNQ
jgi:hypothetical protein